MPVFDPLPWKKHDIEKPQDTLVISKEPEEELDYESGVFYDQEEPLNQDGKAGMDPCTEWFDGYTDDSEESEKMRDAYINRCSRG